jgi:hypothetical protein
MTATSYTDDP